MAPKLIAIFGGYGGVILIGWAAYLDWGVVIMTVLGTFGLQTAIFVARALMKGEEQDDQRRAAARARAAQHAGRCAAGSDADPSRAS